MSGGKHGHTIRRLRRRIDAVLEAERERHSPLPAPPPPINEEHAALRRQIAKLYWILFDDPEKPEGTDPIEWSQLDNVEDEYIELVDKEVELLAEHGVDYSPYDNYKFE
jgi:hypothetical protein